MVAPGITGRRPMLPRTTGKMPMLPGVTGKMSVLPGGRDARPTRSAAAALVAQYEYSPFGEVVGPDDDADGDWRDDAGAFATDNPFRFSTKWLDDAIGVVDYGARMYSATLGRFLNRDPIAEAGGVNLYAFAGNDPVNRMDPFGYHNIPGCGFGVTCPEYDAGAELLGGDSGIDLGPGGSGGDGDVGDNCADMVCPTGWPATYCPTTGDCECPGTGCGDGSSTQPSPPPSGPKKPPLPPRLRGCPPGQERPYLGGNRWENCRVPNTRKETTNGCSRSPDKPLGYPFGWACDEHDRCYATLGKTRAQCDLEFLADMVQICLTTAKTPLQRTACLEAAAIYYAAVRDHGARFYRPRFPSPPVKRAPPRATTPPTSGPVLDA